MMQDGGRSPGAKASDPWCLWPGAEWNVTVESYVVHTNYDEYAIFLTKKNSRHHGPTITAKLYGEHQRQGGPGAGWVRDSGVGRSRRLCFFLLAELQLGDSICCPWRRQGPGSREAGGPHLTSRISPEPPGP